VDIYIKENNIYQSGTITGKHRHRRLVESNIPQESHMQQWGNCYICEHQDSRKVSSRTWQRISFKSLCFSNCGQTVPVGH